MNAYLGLDVGQKRTGVAYTTDAILVPISLGTIITHDSALRLRSIKTYVLERNITHIIVGLPLLPSGEKGAQARFTQQFIAKLQVILPKEIVIEYIDERYSSYHADLSVDTDAASAIKILQVYLDQKSHSKF